VLLNAANSKDIYRKKGVKTENKIKIQARYNKSTNVNELHLTTENYKY